MDEHNPHALALLVIGGREDQRPHKAQREHNQAYPAEPRQGDAADPHKTRRVGQMAQHWKQVIRRGGGL
jgi:hypothetical protein